MVRRMKRLKPAATSAFVPALARRRMSRRDFLKVTGVGLAGTSLLGVAGCTGRVFAIAVASSECFFGICIGRASSLAI